MLPGLGQVRDVAVHFITSGGGDDVSLFATSAASGFIGSATCYQQGRESWAYNFKCNLEKLMAAKAA